MIKSEFLREGSIVMFNKQVAAVKEIACFVTSQTETVSNRPNGVSLFLLSGESVDEIVPFHVLQELELSEQWLKRFGFTWHKFPKKTRTWNGDHRNGLWMTSQESGIGILGNKGDDFNWEVWLVNGDGNPIFMLRWIQFVRQLQNIFLDIREELLVLDGEKIKEEIFVPESKIITDLTDQP